MQNRKISFEIKTGTIQEVVNLCLQLPEFIDPHSTEEYEKRLLTVPHLILVAYERELPVGFKVAYEKQDPNSKGSTYFYSWMGGVLPVYRRMGIAQALADQQESWARQQNYPHITFKTRNRHKNMLLFGISNGFQVIGFEEREKVNENRILLRKFL